MFKANPSQENASSVQDGRKVLSASSVSKGKRQDREETAKGRTDETGKGTAASGAARRAAALLVCSGCKKPREITPTFNLIINLLRSSVAFLVSQVNDKGALNVFSS